jgi:hypothetical protein
VRGHDGQHRISGPLPVLFAGIGTCAEKVLAEFSRRAGSLTVPVQGPFGLVLVDSFGQTVFTGDWPWLADFRLPESLPVPERSELGGHNAGKLQTGLSSLVRRLHSVEPAVDSTTPGRTRLSSYVVVDLSVPVAVAPAVQVMQALRKTDPAHDMTVLALTARTAGTDTTCDNEWFEGWKQLLAHLQNEPCAHRIYLLDGCDADKTWFERPEQLHHLGAEFLLHHGLTCRALLRQNEQTRANPKESLLNVCGSFGCRTIPPDLPAVARRIAERLAREDLAELYQRAVPGGWLESVEEQAQTLAERIAGICGKAQPTKPVAPTGRRDHPRGGLAASAELSDAVARAVAHVCSREPLVSLCHFFKCLQPRLGRSLTRQRLWERTLARRRALEGFRRQSENTYEPMRLWLADPATQWTDRFTPKQQDSPQVAVSRPASVKSFILGGAVFALGLAGVAAGLLGGYRVPVVGGGLLAIVSSLLMTSPTGWVWYARNRIREGQGVTESVAPAFYRRRAGRQALWIAGTLVVLGLAGVAWPLWPEVRTAMTLLWAGIVAVTAVVGVLLVAGAPSESRADQVNGEEALDHVAPPIWYNRATGLACLAAAWTTLWLREPLPMVGDVTVAWMTQLAGLLLVAVGIGLALFPRTGRAYLIDLVPKLPQPLLGGVGARVEENELSRRLGAMAAWVNRVALDPALCLQRAKTSDMLRDRETIFDFLAEDWDRQLAEAVRRELKARSEKNLKTLALQPVLWAECITRELRDPRAHCPDLTSLFALQAVNAWMESHTLAELLSFVNVDLARFTRLTSHLASPHWPATRGDPDVNAPVIAVGKPLWDVLGPRALSGGVVPIVPLDWDADAGAIVALRVVQGLAQGWRGFPGLPGQAHERRPAAPAQPASAEGRTGASEAPPDA